MGAWIYALTNEDQLRWVGPEKGVIALAVAAIVNAFWGGSMIGHALMLQPCPLCKAPMLYLITFLTSTLGEGLNARIVLPG